MKMKGACVLCVLMIFLGIGFNAAAGEGDPISVVVVNSYHWGYPWSDGIVQGIEDVMIGYNIDLTHLQMDTKRNAGEQFKKEAAKKVQAWIQANKPELIIAVDDNASKYVIAPYYKNSYPPVVFCGVNWDASEYGFPCRNVTGMVEITPVTKILAQLKPHAKGSTIGFLGPDTLSSRKEAENIEKYLNLKLVKYFSKDASDWKKGFAQLQNRADMLLLDSDGGLYAEKAAELRSFALANTKIPAGTAFDFMAPYALIAYCKSPEEQGRWAAQTAVKILKGASPSSIPIAQNQEADLIINMPIAKKLGVTFPYDLLSTAERIIE